MLLASSSVGIRPPIQAAQPASSSYEAKTGQSKAYFKGTRPYTVRTVLPSKNALVKGTEVGECPFVYPLACPLEFPFGWVPFRLFWAHDAGILELCVCSRYRPYCIEMSSCNHERRCWLTSSLVIACACALNAGTVTWRGGFSLSLFTSATNLRIHKRQFTSQNVDRHPNCLPGQLDQG